MQLGGSELTGSSKLTGSSTDCGPGHDLIRRTSVVPEHRAGRIRVACSSFFTTRCLFADDVSSLSHASFPRPGPLECSRGPSWPRAADQWSRRRLGPLLARNVLSCEFPIGACSTSLERCRRFATLQRVRQFEKATAAAAEARVALQRSEGGVADGRRSFPRHQPRSLHAARCPPQGAAGCHLSCPARPLCPLQSGDLRGQLQLLHHWLALVIRSEPRWNYLLVHTSSSHLLTMPAGLSVISSDPCGVRGGPCCARARASLNHLAGRRVGTDLTGWRSESSSRGGCLSCKGTRNVVGMTD